MKLRIAGNSLRFRLLQSDVTRLGEDGRLEESVQFGVGEEMKLTYAIARGSESDKAAVVYTPAEILLVLPTARLASWIASTEVGIYETLNIGAGISLSVSVEKDFACLDTGEAENVDTFPNPKANGAC